MKRKWRRRRRPDPQCKRVYDWQWGWNDWNRATISLERCQELAEKACALWDVHTPPIGRAPRTKPYSSYEDGNRTIRLLPDHMNPAMVLHEVAHHICDVRHGTWATDHGPEWLGIFADLLVDFKVAPADVIYAGLRHRKLRFNKPETVKRKRRH